MRVILRQLLALPCKLLIVCLCDFLSLPRNYRRKVHYGVGAVNLCYLSMDILSLLGCFCSLLFCYFPLSYIFPEVFVRGFFPWVHWPCTLNKFWCHWLSFRLAHPNTNFAIYLVPSIRPVVYGIWLHADIAFYCCIVLAPVIHALPAPSCCLAQAPHVAWPKPMACQLLSACCTSNERVTGRCMQG